VGTSSLPMAPSLRHVAALTLALALAQPSCAEPEYFGEKPGDVELLSTKDFETKVLESSDLWLVEFYAPWCGHCQKLAPEWLDAAKRVKDTARLGAVDCTEDDKELCGTYGVKGFPTIKVFGADKKKPTDYSAERDADAIETFVKAEAGKAAGGTASSKLVPTVDYVKMHEFLHQLKPKLPKVLIFPGEKGVPSWFKMVASGYKRTTEEDDNKYKQGKKVETKKVKKVSPTIVFGAANSSDTRTSSRFKIEDTPKVFICFGGHYTSFDGGFNKKELKEFLDEYVDMEVPKAEDLPEGEWSPTPRFPEQSTPKVQKKKKSLTQLSSENLYQTCLKGTACLTLLGSGGADADKAAVEVLDALAGKYRNDKLNFAQVDGTVQTGFAEALGGKDGLPALVVIKGKRDKKMKYSRFEGATIGAEAAGNFVDKFLGGDLRFKKLKELDLMDEAQLKMDAMMDEE